MSTNSSASSIMHKNSCWDVHHAYQTKLIIKLNQTKLNKLTNAFHNIIRDKYLFPPFGVLKYVW